MAVVAGRGWPYFDPEYETLSLRIHPPRVVIDNASCEDATVIKVDSQNRHGILLTVVQALADLDLFISKAYVSSDGDWFMEAFHVTDQNGNKLTDEGILEYIEQTIGANEGAHSSSSSKTQMLFPKTVGVQSLAEYTAIEICGADRPGLLSEISEVLTGLGCNVVAAEVWTHKARVACVVFVNEEETGGPIEDKEKVANIERTLKDIVKGNSAGKTDFFMGLTHAERRLHQLMAEDADRSIGPQISTSKTLDSKGCPVVTVRNCVDSGYLVITIQCKDRRKLFFDTVCTLTDMEYMIFHASAISEGSLAYQEFYVRHIRGHRLDTESSRMKLIQCLEAALERRAPEGLRLEIRTQDRLGLLSELTKVFCDNGLSVTRADVSTADGMAVNTFYVTDEQGNPADSKTVELIREKFGQTLLQVKDLPLYPESVIERPRFSIGSFFKSHSERLLSNLGLIKTSI